MRVLNKLVLPNKLENSLRQGHPWVYRNQVPGAPDLSTGTWVRVRCGGFTAYGLWDAEGGIAVRIFSRLGVPDERWLAERIAEAWEARGPVRASGTSGYRWVYGESDGLPGLVVDLYRGYAVIQTYTDCVRSLVDPVADALLAHASLEGILWRRAGEPLESVWGRLPPPDLTIEENGLLFHIDLFAGQKTGFYFDHRENRLALSAWCREKKVLDCFCYTGAFSLYALSAGAATVTACDRASGAVETAKRNFIANGHDPSQHTFIVKDAFEMLKQCAGEGRRFDIVVLDPPSFARERKGRHAATRAYVRLNRLALACVAPGGLLASASCTSQVSPLAFREALAEAARLAGKRLLILHQGGQALDHPVPVYFPEAQYLKFVVSSVWQLA
ncbi:class I SAM-dependent rRNA methyltransferase [Chloroflexota bacterium]